MAVSRPNYSRIADHRGEVHIGMLIAGDVIYVKAVKADLLYNLRQISDDAISVYVAGGICYVTSGA